MEGSSAIDQARRAFARKHWRKAYELLSAADSESPLSPADLERLADTAYLVGMDERAVALWTRAHHEFVDQGDVEHAARRGYHLGLHMLLAGNVAQATGWLTRSNRLLKECEGASAASGFGDVVTGLFEMGKGEIRNAGRCFEQAVALAERSNDSDLLALGLLGHGQCMIRADRNLEGVARLDEAMVAVVAGDVSSVLAGIIYCAVILTCQRIFDLGRAREWTRQLDDWCAAQPDLVPYRGQCLVHRSEILQLQGDWTQALAEVKRAREHIGERSEAVAGRACYQQGELHRLRGEFARAGEMYREAGRFGCEPQPGLSLLLLAEDKPDAAAASIRGVIDPGGSGRGPGASWERTRLLGACVEILLAADDLDGARAAADELTRVAADSGAPLLLASATGASGAVLFAQGKARAALALARESWGIWEQLQAPYEASRARAHLARACRELGDAETARLHHDAACSVFERLGATPDLVELQRLAPSPNAGPSAALTSREREVLSLVASGETNRGIAIALGISEHTVARHLSNIFDKLGVTSRTAASAFAHKHKLV